MLIIYCKKKIWFLLLHINFILDSNFLFVTFWGPCVSLFYITVGTKNRVDRSQNLAGNQLSQEKSSHRTLVMKMSSRSFKLGILLTCHRCILKILHVVRNKHVRVPWKGKEEYGLQKSRVARKRGHIVKSDLRKKCDAFLLYSKLKLKNLLICYTRVQQYMLDRTIKNGSQNKVNF